MRILIVEDNAELAGEIARQTARAGFTSDLVGSLGDARDIAALQNYALALVDRGLPDGDGVVLASDLRRAQPGLRVIMLTVLAETRDKIAGLEAGADDYLTKPFEPDELIARIRACLRRPGGEASPPIDLANLSFACETREVRVAGAPVVLQKRELALLEALLRRAGRVVLRETLAEDVFGKDDDINWHTLSALASQLRMRLKEAGAEIDIQTVRGVGYFIIGADA
jgi:two-component system, OmpR family, response regulator